MKMYFHSFHMVTMSPWPLFMGFGVLSVVSGLINMMVYNQFNLLFLSLLLILVVSFLWWRDVVREGTYEGVHTSEVLSGLMMGMILFIISEILFFFSFFWAFFHSSLSPNLELGLMWPPCGVFPFNAFQVPLLNTVILLSSGVSITWCHQLLLNNNWWHAKLSLMMTWIMGIYFLFLQIFEYKMSSFSISDSVFGASFFMATGFHGLHVIIGTLFLFVMWVRMWKNHFSNQHHFGFEASAWYWHFVDVVWLFLFSVVYWWGT